MADRNLQRPFIREWREYRGLSLEAVGQAIGMVKGNLSKVERGINPYVQDKLEAMARVLGCTTADLLSRPPGVAPSIEHLLAFASPEQRSQISRVAEVLVKYEHTPPLPADDYLAQLTKTAAVRNKKRPGKKPPRRIDESVDIGDE